MIKGKIKKVNGEILMKFSSAELKDTDFVDADHVFLTPIKNGGALLTTEQPDTADYMKLYDIIEKTFYKELKELADK